MRLGVVSAFGPTRTAREGSFQRAARVAGVSTSTIARRVSALERSLGVQLVRRGPDGASIEPAASRLVELGARMEAELAIATRDARAERQQHAGVVRVSTGEGFIGTVTRVASLFRAEHPETSFELVSDARMVDLAKREADLGLRVAKTVSAPVVSRKLGELRLALYASEAYLVRAGVPSLDRLREHAFVGFEGVLENQPELRWLRARGAERFVMKVSTTDALVEATAQGQGIAALPALLADRERRLVPVASSELPPTKPVYLAFHREMLGVPRVKAFANRLASEIGALLAADAAPLKRRRRLPTSLQEPAAGVVRRVR